ncbi:helix-turn-helix domain-containing protein [Candidatus Pacearchaeota archaeon]|nr:helix-turn-helix domain-containing protein [Candidatus Pacearchaeota archaeon]
MDENKFMLISMEDETSKAVAEVLGSKTCKKIINHLAEIKEASQKDLSDALKIPMNTLDYNMKKLLESGFIQKKKNFFWSKKGKKIIMYELSNKSIVISPKKSTAEKIKSIIPAFILTAAGTFAVAVFEKINYATRNVQTYDASIESEILSVAAKAPTIISPQTFPIWGWFLAGALLAIFIISIINWRKL